MDVDTPGPNLLCGRQVEPLLHFKDAAFGVGVVVEGFEKPCLAVCDALNDVVLLVAQFGTKLLDVILLAGSFSSAIVLFS